MGDVDRFRHDVAASYATHIVDAGKEAQFLILCAFLVTFAAVRLITHAIRAGRLRRVLRNVVTPGGTHMHHLVPGILTLIATGYLAIGLDPVNGRAWLAIAFGVGAALTLDEFALWLHLEDVYWAKQGRASVDAVVIAATVVALGLLGQPFLADLGRSLERLAGVA